MQGRDTEPRLILALPNVWRRVRNDLTWYPTMIRAPGNTPILVGAGQYTDHIDAPHYAALSPQSLAARALELALFDAGVGAARQSIDALVAVRTVADSLPAEQYPLVAPFGGPDNFPRSVAGHVGCNPHTAIYSIACGDEPQLLVSEMADRIAAGEFKLVALCGAEAAATTRLAQRQGQVFDWTEEIAGQCDDRGACIEGLRGPQMAQHGMAMPLDIYPLFEHARRHRLKASADDYAQTMAELLERFNQVARENPYATHREALSRADIASVTAGNRIVSYPYTKACVARDAVNQGAAVLMTSVSVAQRLGIDPAKWVYLHSCASAAEPSVTSRVRLDTSVAMTQTYQQALASAQISKEQIRHMDIYSCFPIAVFIALEALGMDARDPRALTVTGGLPYFGGPGNNYTMHAIASMIETLRGDPGSYGLVGANGGYLSKHAVGVYSTTSPDEWHLCSSNALQASLDRIKPRVFEPQPRGTGVVESFSVVPVREGFRSAILGTLTESGRRFVAHSHDNQTITDNLINSEAIGRLVTVHPSQDGCNIFSLMG